MVRPHTPKKSTKNWLEYEIWHNNLILHNTIFRLNQANYKSSKHKYSWTCFSCSITKVRKKEQIELPVKGVEGKKGQRRKTRKRLSGMVRPKMKLAFIFLISMLHEKLIHNTSQLTLSVKLQTFNLRTLKKSSILTCPLWTSKKTWDKLHCHQLKHLWIRCIWTAIRKKACQCQYTLTGMHKVCLEI